MSKCSSGCGCGSNDDLRSKVINPGDLISYQDGAIVSRTIVEKPSGTLTVFAFDRGQALSEHTAPFDAVVQVLDGKGRFTIAAESSDVAAGQMLIMPANVPHAVTAVEPFKMLLTMIRS